MIRVASSIGLARMKKGRFVSDIRVWHMSSGPGVVPVQRGMEFHQLPIPTAVGFTFGQHSGKPRFVRVRKRFVEQAIDQFLEDIGVAHAGASVASVRSMQSSKVRRMRRSVSDTALGCLPTAAAIALTEAPGS